MVSIPFQLGKSFYQQNKSNKGVNKQISIFNKTILNITTNFIHHETKMFNDRKPPRINHKVKTMIQEKKQNLSALFEK